MVFRETMSGGFALGESDPAAGARRGLRDATPLVLHATLSIADVRAFVSDATHTGTLAGTVSFPPLGSDLPVASGFFRLFTRTGDPALKLMQYVLVFQCGTDAYA